MMKGKSKKLVAWLLALTLLASPSAGIRAFADDVVGTDTVQDAAVTGNSDDTAAPDSNTDDGTTAAVPDDSAVAGDPSVVDGSSPSGDSSAAGEPTADDQPTAGEPTAEEPTEPTEAEGQETEDSAVEDGGLINFLFMEKDVLQAPGEQNVIISFGDGSEQLASVKLILAGEDGRQSEIPLTTKISSYYQFLKAYENQEAGNYHLVAFTYELDGHKKCVDLEEKAGISTKFTVLSETADEETVEPSIEVTTTTSDEISNSMENEIQSTIQEAAEEVVDQVVEGAVELGTSSTEKSYSRVGVITELTAVTDHAVKLGSYSAEAAYTGTTSYMVVVLDPGHGGSDEGSSGNGLKESELNLKVAKACKAALEKDSGIKVYMTRETDKYVGLEERVEIADKYGADLFVSIHMNSATKKEAQGAEVYYPNRNYNYMVSEDGKSAAENILKELKDLGLVDRGIKTLDYPEKDEDDEDYKESVYDDGSQADYYSVIRDSKENGFPGIIVEHAFISNEEDAAKLASDAFLTKLGEADARGIIKYSKETTDISPVYDFTYYVNKYADIKKEYSNNPSGAFNHFINTGMKEGRQGSAEFDVNYYKSQNADLRNAFGNDLVKYYYHYVNYGKAEGRKGSDVPSDQKPNVDAAAIYDGVNYADVYDFDYYIEHYPDLKAAFSNNTKGALEHFVVFGMKEGRQAKGTFDVVSYKNRYEDLRKAFGSSWKSYYLHYINYGKKEGRIAVGEGADDASKPTGTTQYGRFNLAPVYDFNYYIEKYPDIKAAFGASPEKAIDHFVQHGMDEGRLGNAEFNVHAYKSKYSDLRAAFGNDLSDYYIHYLEHGIKEGRTAELVAVTTYRGVDYAAVYNFEYYVGKYPDLKAVFESDPAGALQHYIEYGIKESRQANEEFNINAYKNNYDDLRKAFGDDNKKYVEHYISCGKSEGRDARNFIYHRIDDMGFASTTVDQMVKYFLANASYPTYYANNTNVTTIKEFCELYVSECTMEGINPAVAFCQAMKETNFLKFTGDVKISQYNFAGLGAIGNGVAGLTFPNIQTGIRAHVQHLKAYANSELLVNTCVDPRFQYVQRGSAMYVEWLGIQENPIPGCGWASSPGYGSSIINDYMGKLSNY